MRFRRSIQPPGSGPWAAGPAAAPAGAEDDLAGAFADLDGLSLEEKIALFS